MKLTIEITSHAEFHTLFEELAEFFRNQTTPNQLSQLRRGLVGPTEALSDAVESAGAETTSTEEGK